MILLAAAAALALCPAQGVRVSCVHDGDSLVLERERIRIENIDAPELAARCPQERAQALAARNRLVVLLRPGFALERRGTDKYGRTLARLSVNGRDVGQTLVSEGLARRWDGKRRPWC